MRAPAPSLCPEASPVGAAEAEALFADLADEARLLCAVSGGPDSMALLCLLSAWAQREGRPALLAATVDHGLRPEAGAEAAMVAAFCGRLGVPHVILHWDGAKPAAGLQEAARRARYDLLAGEAQRRDGALIVTAHTLDDQAETLLMRLAHGSGPAGLAGMRPRGRLGAAQIARPLLALSKARLVATAEAHRAPFVRDPSNTDLRFERVRWRQLAPVLGEYGIDAPRLGLLAARLARQEAALVEAAAQALETARLAASVGGGFQFDLRMVAREPDEILLRILGNALREAGAGPGHPRLERLEACLEALLPALQAGSATRRTLSGCILSLDRKGVLTIRPEGPRRRGVHPATS